VILFTWVLALVLIGSVTGVYSEFRWRKLFASVIASDKKKSAEIDRLRGIIFADEDMMRDHKEQIADRDATIESLEAERDEHAKRILSLQDSYRMKCAELDANINAGVDRVSEIRAVALDMSETIKRFAESEEGSQSKQQFEPITSQATFQPKRPEDQPQKPTCDN